MQLARKKHSSAAWLFVVALLPIGAAHADAVTDWNVKAGEITIEVPRLRERVVSTLGRWSPPVWRHSRLF